MANALAGLADTTGPEGAAAPSPAAMAEHLLAGGSPLDFTERPDWFSYSTLDTFTRCPRQYALRYLCRLPAEQPRPAADFGSAAHSAFQAFTRERRDRAGRGEPAPGRADLGRFFEAAWKNSSLVADPYAESWLARAEPMLDAFWVAESAADGRDHRRRSALPPHSRPGPGVERRGHRLHRPDRSAAFRRGRVDRLQDRPDRVADGRTVEPSAVHLRPRLQGWLGLGRPERVTLDFVKPACAPRRSPRTRNWTASAKASPRVPRRSEAAITPLLQAIAPAAGAITGQCVRLPSRRPLHELAQAPRAGWAATAGRRDDELHFCCICGALILGLDLEDELDGEGPGRDICGACNRTRNFRYRDGLLEPRRRYSAPRWSAS